MFKETTIRNVKSTSIRGQYCTLDRDRKHVQDRQCTYNVTLRYVRATIVAVEKQ